MRSDDFEFDTQPTPLVAGPAHAQPRPPTPQDEAEARVEQARQAAESWWTAVVRQVGENVAEPLTAALEHVGGLIATGRIAPEALHALRDAIDRARQAGMASQRLARFATHDLLLAPERVHLPQMLKDVLGARQHEFQLRGHPVKPVVNAADVLADPSLVYALVEGALDWAVGHARQGVQVRIDRKLWPRVARIQLEFEHRHERACDAGDAALDDLPWRLVEQTAEALDVQVERRVEDHRVHVTLEFAQVAADGAEGPGLEDPASGFSPSVMPRPVAGSQVLVVVSRRALRMDVREALRTLGVHVDFVGSIDEAQRFCAQGWPHAVIVESVLRGERFDDWRADVLAARPDCAFLEIVEEGHSFEISGFSGSSIAKVGRDALPTSLAAALSYELTKEV